MTMNTAQIEKKASVVIPESVDTAQEIPVSSLAARPTGRQAEPVAEEPRILEELVIEEVSIDGMCGVY